MGTIAKKIITRQDPNPAWNTSPASGGDTFVNDGESVLLINNGSGSSITITVASVQLVDGLSVPDLNIVVPANSVYTCGKFAVATYGNNVSLTYSSVTSLELALVEYAV